MSGTNTLTNYEYYQLVSKGKSGWRCFFIMRDRITELGEEFNQHIINNREMRRRIVEGEDCDIEYLKSQFVEMYDMLKKETECPVCYEVLTKDNIDVPKCGHIICKTCIESIKTVDTPAKGLCPSCRKKY